MESEPLGLCMRSLTVYLAKVISPVSARQSCSLWSKFSVVFGYVSASMRVTKTACDATPAAMSSYNIPKTFTPLTRGSAKTERSSVEPRSCSWDLCKLMVLGFHAAKSLYLQSSERQPPESTTIRAATISPSASRQSN